MTRIGILLVVLGVGSFVLPMIGFQFRLMDLVADYQPFAGIIVAAIGAVLLYLGYTQSQKASAPAPAASPAPVPSASTSEPPSA
jgi:threonine/homoserine/homoserine lactone efflux protein